MVITILPSDDAAGVFGFDSDSLALVVEEQLGGTPISLVVVRGAGTFGDVSIYWEVEGSYGDIFPTNGYISFAAGQTEGLLELTVIDDEVSELSWLPISPSLLPCPFLILPTCLGPRGARAVLCQASKCQRRWEGE